MVSIVELAWSTSLPDMIVSVREIKVSCEYIGLS